MSQTSQIPQITALPIPAAPSPVELTGDTTQTTSSAVHHIGRIIGRVVLVVIGIGVGYILACIIGLLTGVIPIC